MWASCYGQLSTLKLLLQRGANPNHKGTHSETALMFASSRGHIHVLRELISSGADVNAFDEVINNLRMTRKIIFSLKGWKQCSDVCFIR